MATAPAPTEVATRFVELWTTSPTAKMPGTEVSRNIGGRDSGHRESAASIPVERYPRGSRWTSASSQSVRGWARS
jgi:hypothetical protein